MSPDFNKIHRIIKMKFISVLLRLIENFHYLCIRIKLRRGGVFIRTPLNTRNANIAWMRAGVTLSMQKSIVSFKYERFRTE